jgi:NADPH:quinone reductase-like Zn-dependent oxidoreductase
VRAAGVNAGDWHLLTGKPYLMRLAGFGIRRPKRRGLGWDLAGTVEAVGGEVTRFAVGDEVVGTCDAAFAELAVAAEDRLVHKPEGVTFEDAAAAPTAGMTALQGLRHKAGVQAGQKVLVTGAGGGVGTYAVQIAKADGAEVTGVCSTGKIDLVRSLGADHVVDYTREDFTAAGTRYDMIMDIAGNRGLSALRRALTPSGTVIFAGGEGGGDITGGMFRQVVRSGVRSLATGQSFKMLLSLPKLPDLEALFALVDAGTIRAPIDRTYTLGETPAAIAVLGTNHTRGKLVVTM